MGIRLLYIMNESNTSLKTEKSTKNLLKTISLLQKDVTRLQQEAKEHNRSKLIQQLHKDISQQDDIIEIITKLVADDDKVNKNVIDYLQRGPKQIKCSSRYEVIKEMEDFKSK